MRISSPGLVTDPNELTNINIYLVIIINIYHNIHADFEYEYVVDADIGYRCSDSCDAVYKNLPKKHHVLKKAKNCQFCHAKRFPVKGLPSATGKGRLIYIFRRYQ